MFTFNSKSKFQSIENINSLTNHEAYQILCKVKALPLIPNYNVVTLSQLEEYFGVSGNAIRSAYYKPNHGVHYTSKNAGAMNLDSNKYGIVPVRLVDFKKIAASCEKIDSRYVLSFRNGLSITVPACGAMCLSSRAVLCMALVLNNSSVARELQKAIARTPLFHSLGSSNERLQIA